VGLYLEEKSERTETGPLRAKTTQHFFHKRGGGVKGGFPTKKGIDETHKRLHQEKKEKRCSGKKCFWGGLSFSQGLGRQKERGGFQRVGCKARGLQKRGREGAKAEHQSIQ